MSVQRSIRRLSFVLVAAIGLIACEVTVGPRETRPWGAILVDVATEGTRLNPVTYTVSIDSAIQGYYANMRTTWSYVRLVDSVDIVPVMDGAHHVTLLGVSSNCTVDPGTTALGNTHIVRVRPDERLLVEFRVTCVSP